MKIIKPLAILGIAVLLTGCVVINPPQSQVIIVPSCPCIQGSISQGTTSKTTNSTTKVVENTTIVEKETKPTIIKSHINIHPNIHPKVDVKINNHNKK